MRWALVQESLMAGFQQLARILAGYAVASFASGIAVAVAIGNPMAAPFIALMIAAYAAAPSLAAILLGEFKPVRSVRYYVVAGTIIGTGLPLVLMGRSDAFLPIVGLCFGPVAGAIYWWIAGRRAGVWKRIES
jgi:hypothetical protein